jgi:Ser/Thr protein kinase RdoA (MazF antagonist)
MSDTLDTEKDGTPIDFKSLPFERQKEHLRGVAQRALCLWGYPENSRLALLNITENATYRVDADGLKTMVMRVHRIDYAERKSVETEIAWILALKRETMLNITAPLKALGGQYVETIYTQGMEERRNVVCFDFVPGKSPRDSQDDNDDLGKIMSAMAKIPKWVTVPLFRGAAAAYDRLGRLVGKKNKLTVEDANMYRTLGRIMATIHRQSESWQAPAFYQRIEWDWNATFGAGWNNYYGAHYWELTDYLKPGEIRAIDDCAALMRRRVEAYGKGAQRYGMIHSDLRMANLLINEGKITVLDFDDCGRGWFMYDLACILGFQEHRPDLRHVIDVIVEGFREVRPLEADELREIMTFMMMRRVGLLQAIMYHLHNTDTGSGESAQLSPEIMAFYAKGTAILARSYLREYAGLPLASPPAGEKAVEKEAPVRAKKERALA